MTVYLLDSHILYWALRDLPELPAKAREIIQAPENDLLVSSISFYELMFKAKRGRIHTSMLFAPEASRRAGFSILDVSETHFKQAAVLDWIHGDPFDRILAAQAIAENCSLVSVDEAFDAIDLQRVW